MIRHLWNKPITVSYIYEIREVLDFIRQEFNFNGDIGIEVYPTEVEEELLNKIQLAGITLISLGIQTFNKEYIVD